MKKPTHGICKIISAMLAAAFLLVGCSYKSVYEIREEFDYKNVDETFNDQIKGSSEFTKVAENDYLELLINGATAEVKVIDKKTGAAWFTNPQNSGRIGNDLSQMKIEYYSNDNLQLYISSADSTDKSQYTIEKTENGVRVNYLFGSKPVIYLVPILLTVERYKEIYNKLGSDDQSILDSYYKFTTLKDKSDADRAMLTTKYPILKKRDLYIAQISTDYYSSSAVYASPYLMKKLQNVFVKAGYTAADLERDNKENEVEIEEEPDYSVTASIIYRLEKDSLSVTIPNDSISFNGKYTHITNITLLPLFGAADNTKNGYIFVPDGSGALINLNNNKVSAEYFSQMLYGPDMTLSTTESVKQDYSVQMNMPVYGMKVEDEAFLGVIESGDAIARIDADISGRTNSYNFVSVTFQVGRVAKSDKLTLGINTGNKYQRRITKSDLSIRYFFLNGEEADYVGMAHRYQKYLLDNGLLNRPDISESMPLCINTIGAVDKNKSILGIPVNSVLPLTRYDQCIDIMKDLKGRGVNNLVLQLDSWCNYGIKNTAFNDLTLLKELGGESKFRQLIDYAKENNIPLYPSCNFQYIGKDTLFDGFNANKNAARTLENMVSYTYEMNLIAQVNMSEDKKIVVSSKHYGSLISDFISKYSKYNINSLSLSMMGYYLNGDYNENNVIDRHAAKGHIVEQIERLKDKKFDLAVNIGNFYTLKGVSFITEAPLQSSNNYLFDSTVPFYQIVLHGIIPYSSDPLNMVSDFDTYVLKIIETGAIPSYKWIYESNTELKDTKYNLYSVNYEAWVDDAVSTYNKVNSAIGDCQKAKIIGHSIIAPGVAKTSYDNGTDVYVNYNDEPYDDGLVTVGAKDYKVVKGVNRN